MRHVCVRNLERFQHYKKRRPPWVKWYTSVLTDEHFASMSPNARLVYALLLLVAADRGNRIPEDAGWLAVELNLPRKLVAGALAELLAAEYLVCASNGASNPAGISATPRVERAEKRVKPTRTTTDVGGRS